jgi:hypothetical protein
LAQNASHFQADTARFRKNTVSGSLLTKLPEGSMAKKTSATTLVRRNLRARPHTIDTLHQVTRDETRTCDARLQRLA